MSFFTDIIDKMVQYDSINPSFVLVGADNHVRDEEILYVLSSISGRRITSFYGNVDIQVYSVFAMDEVRELIDWCRKRPMVAKKKCVVLFDAHKHNYAVMNALLKVIEEVKYVAFFLTTSDKQLLLPTIVSRSFVFEISGLPDYDFLYSSYKKDAMSTLNSILKGSLHKAFELKITGDYIQCYGMLHWYHHIFWDMWLNSIGYSPTHFSEISMKKIDMSYSIYTKLMSVLTIALYDLKLKLKSETVMTTFFISVWSILRGGK